LGSMLAVSGIKSESNVDGKIKRPRGFHLWIVE